MTSKKGKVAVVALAGAFTAFCVWVSKDFAGVVVPAEAAAAFQVIVTAAVQFFLPDEMEA
jgi:hypothetical protein